LLGFHARILDGVGGKVGDERLNHGVAQVLSGADVVEMLARPNMKALLAPVLLDQEVGAELVAAPGGKDEAARQLFQEAGEFGDFIGAPWISSIAAPGDGRTPPRLPPAGTEPLRQHRVFRCWGIVFRLPVRGSELLVCRHENNIRFTKTVPREFSGCVMRHGRRGGVCPNQRESPAGGGV
jgi:hypothetical protein